MMGFIRRHYCDLEKHCLAALLLAIAVLMLVEAVRRHGWPNTDPVPLRAAAGCLAWLASIGMARAAALGLHFNVPVFRNRASKLARSRIDQFADIMFLFFALASLVVGSVVLIRSLYQPAPTVSPIIHLAVPIGSALTVLRLLQRLLGGHSPEADDAG